MAHIPVLLNETLKFLDPKANTHFIDCTVGEGGHAAAILQRTGPHGRLLGLDRDAAILERAQRNLAHFKERVLLVHASFSDLQDTAARFQFPKADGVILDLGLATFHLEQSRRGFSFQRDEALDMRFDPDSTSVTAADILNTWDLESLTSIFLKFGEERFAREIARRVVEERRHQSFKGTSQLSVLVEDVTAKRREPRRRIRSLRGRRIHPATRVFQALRIAVNEELQNITQALPQTLAVLRFGGRVIVISYHSLEDRIVKHFFLNEVREERMTLLVKKPLRPHADEVARNPRARSAKLRCAIKREP